MNWLLKNSRYIFLVLTIIVALPFPSSFVGGLLWFSPYVFLITVLSSKSFVLLNLLGLGLLILIAFKRRFICQYMCPLGVVCDQASMWAIRKKKLGILKNFNKTLALFSLGFAIFGLSVFVILDPFYIFQTTFEPIRSGVNLTNAIRLIPLVGIIVINLFYPDSWCSSLCPLGGVQMLVAGFRKNISSNKTSPSIKSRRLFIASLAGLSGGILVSPIIRKRKASHHSQIKPPSSLADEEYLLTCVRCGNCVGACPTGILYQQTEVNLMAFLAPAVDFSESYCLPDCKRCGDVCPSGALTKFSLEEKKDLIMAIASVDYENCLLYKQKECNQCKQYCAYDAVSYELQPSLMNPIPVFDKEKCVGCAACKIVCPANVIYIIPHPHSIEI